MRVNLTKPYFAPNAGRYKAGIHNFPDSWEDRLPKTATILEDEPDAEIVKEKADKKVDAPKAEAKPADAKISLPLKDK